MAKILKFTLAYRLLEGIISFNWGHVAIRISLSEWLFSSTLWNGQDTINLFILLFDFYKIEN